MRTLALPSALSSRFCLSSSRSFDDSLFSLSSLDACCIHIDVLSAHIHLHLSRPTQQTSFFSKFLVFSFVRHAYVRIAFSGRTHCPTVPFVMHSAANVRGSFQSILRDHCGAGGHCVLRTLIDNWSLIHLVQFFSSPFSLVMFYT